MICGPLIIDSMLSAGDKNLYSLLWCLGDRFKKGRHSQRLLADLLKVSTRTIRRGLRNLSQSGLIITTLRRPLTTLIEIVDPITVYGVRMEQFFDHVKERSEELRMESEDDKDLGKNGFNRTNLSSTIGQICPMKYIKGSRLISADIRQRISVDDSMEKVNEKKASLPKKNTRSKKTPVNLRIPTMTPKNPTRWGGKRFYLHCIQCASIKGVVVRDPDARVDHAPLRFAREMNYAITAYSDGGYTREEFLNLLTTIFEQWHVFKRHFTKHQFSVYDLRPNRYKICELHTRVKQKSNLEGMEDFDEEEGPEVISGHIIYVERKD